MTATFLLLGVILSALLLASIARLPTRGLKQLAAGAAVVVFLFFFTLSSFRFVGEDSVGVVVKNVGFKSLPPGKIIATDGEKGPQARILGPGWHPWLWPLFFDVEMQDVVEIDEGEVGLLTTTDGRPLPPSDTYAPEWSENETAAMLNAEHFLVAGGGFKGPQTTVLGPGKYRLNTKLFRVEKVPVTNIPRATVGVVKSNVGPLPEVDPADGLVEPGQRGIWRRIYTPQKLYLNPRAYEVTMISTAKTIVRYAAAGGQGDEREIRVRTSDGFTFPVDVRIEFLVEPQNAAKLVASVGDDQTRLREVLNSAVRAIFRNNAEGVKALDYVQQRSTQESQSLAMLRDEMAKIGVTVSAVRIGDVGSEETLGALLKTQTDREIALQEQMTFQEQQRAAEQKKELSRTEQEAEEERRLATASYSVQIAEQEKERRIIEASAEAEAISIRAQAQADAYALIAQQIGKGNAALVELLKIVGERNIQITPRVMVIGEGGPGSVAGGETTALIGTMLDTMLSREPEGPLAAPPAREPQSPAVQPASRPAPR